MNERVAVLEQRVKQLEADEQRQRNSRNRLLGWAIGPSLMLFMAGLALYGQVQLLEHDLESLRTMIEDLQGQINRLWHEH